MRLLALLALTVAFAGAQQAPAKEFRHYYGLQWEFEPTALPTQPLEVKKGDTIFETRLLPTQLFVLDDDFTVAGRLIAGKGTQFAPAVSAKSIRCTLGPGVVSSLSADRRVCIVDLDKDGVFDAFFDEGLGMQMAQMQFTGCMPTAPAKGVAPSMTRLDPRETQWPFNLAITLGMLKPRKGKPAEFRFDVTVKRDDKPALSFMLCEAGYMCRWKEGDILNAPGGLSFRAAAQDAAKAAITVLAPFRREGFYDMSPAKRPDPLYCPGTLFVSTDQHDSW